MTMPLRRLLAMFSAACGLLHAALALAVDALPEYTVKAGYLYNFAMLTDWPPNAVGSSLELCMLGSDDFGSALDSIRGRMVNNRRINVRVITDPSEAKTCHVLFVAGLERETLAKVMREIAGLPVLTVTDDENLARMGITIFLRPERQRLVFEINANAARSVNLNISARLLRLARGGVGE